MRILRIDPPNYLFVSFTAIAVLHFFLPGMRIFPAPWNLLGAGPLAVGVVLNLLADRSF